MHDFKKVYSVVLENNPKMLFSGQKITPLGKFWANKTFFQKLISPISLVSWLSTFHKSFQKILIKRLLSYIKRLFLRKKSICIIQVIIDVSLSSKNCKLTMPLEKIKITEILQISWVFLWVKTFFFAKKRNCIICRQ